MNGVPTVSDIEGVLLDRFPAEWAEPWDRVGLLAGSPADQVTGVLATLDVTPSAIERAVALRANVIVSHHPAFLTPPSTITPGRGPAGVLYAATRAGVSLIAAHTNLDRSPEAASALPRMFDLRPMESVERGLAEMSLVTVFVPRDDVVAVVDAMARAGAGRIGRYERCSFRVSGTGEFTPPDDANPTVGMRGMVSTAAEDRVEMVCPRPFAASVVEAARHAHPYKEPLIAVSETTIARSTARLGMYCATEEPRTLSELAATVAVRTGLAPRVWGDPARVIESVVTATGSASSLIGDVLSTAADCLLAGEVRYHDALDASAAGLAIIEVGHDVSEWPLVPLLADAIRCTDGLEAAMVHVDPPDAAWWTL